MVSFAGIPVDPRVRSTFPYGGWPAEPPTNFQDMASAATAFLLLSALAAQQPGREHRKPTEEELRSHQRMLEAIAEMRKRVPDEHPFLETKTLRQLLPRIAQAQGDKNPAALIQALTKAGQYELRAGQNKEAVESLQRALALAAELPESSRREPEIQVHYTLGIAFLRVGETMNCVARHSSESCLMPIAGKGVHLDQEGSRSAITQFRAVMELTDANDARHTAARWLLNIAYMTVGEYPDEVPESERIDPKAFRPTVPFPHFPEIAAELGLNNPDLSGSVIPDDFDSDGDLDLLTCSFDPAEQMHYYESEGGTYTDRSADAGLTGFAGGLHMTPTDFDGDGQLDVLVLRGAWIGKAGCYPRSLLHNLGGPSFVDVSYAAGLDAAYPTQTAAWADYDLDGDLDVFIGSESIDATHPYPSQFYVNDGKGKFRECAGEAGVLNERWAKGTNAGDVDEDGYADVYVSNFGHPNRLYRNKGDLTFEDIAADVGVEKPIFSFSTFFFDYDNDGHLDLFVGQYSDSQNVERVTDAAAHYMGVPSTASDTLKIYRGDGRGHFQDRSRELGVDFSPQPMGSGFGDLDDDGFLDFYLSTGSPSFDSLMPNVMFHNARGKRFEDVTFAGGFGHLQKGHGVSFLDLDNDGDEDVFSQMGGAFQADGFADVLFENPGFGNHWLRLTLVGTESNRLALGAHVRVDLTEDGASRSVWRDVTAGSSFGNNPLALHIGLGRASKADRIVIQWPRKGAAPLELRDVAGDRHVRVVEGKAEIEELPEKHFRLRE